MELINSEPKLIKFPSIKSKGRSRRLNDGDAHEIARLVATRKCTEQDACIALSINPLSWKAYKGKHKREPAFSDLVTRMREHKIDGMVSLIEASAVGEGLKQRDWRAGAWIAERLAPERFAQVKSDTPAVTNNLNVTVMSDTLKRIYSVESVLTDVKQLESPAYVPFKRK